MIPTADEAKKLWEKYNVPGKKRIHLEWVAKVAVYMANRLGASTREPINTDLLLAAAFLHDIDKAVAPMPGERHPDTAVRILREEGLTEVADVVVTHPLHAILDPVISPKTWEQKLLYLADKMVKYDVVGVDGRFLLWKDEHLPPDAQRILDACYPKVKALEQEVFTLAQISLDDLVKLA